VLQDHVAKEEKKAGWVNLDPQDWEEDLVTKDPLGWPV